MTLLGQAELLALEVTNTHIHLLDLTAISDTAMAGSISQAWGGEMEPWSWLCSFLSDRSWRVGNSICSVSSRMQEMSSCLPTPRLCESSRNVPQRWDSTPVPARPQPGLSSLPPAVPVPRKEKLQDERGRSWQRPSTCSWEIMLGMRKMCKGNTRKS